MNTSLEKLRIISSVFTRPSFAELARTGDYQATFSGLVKSGVASSTEDESQSLDTLFETIAARLSKSYRNEYVYKSDLANRLIFGRHSPRTAGLQLELPIGRSIVDIAVANGTSTAYEIKTEFDTTRRLGSQTYDYLRAFDRVFVVTHPLHIHRYERELDPRVGLIALSTTGSMKTIRDATSNVRNVRPEVIFRTLRKEEYLAAIKNLFGSVPDLPNGLIHSHCERLFASITPNAAHDILVAALRARTTNANMVNFVSKLPPSLRTLGYATPLSQQQRHSVIALLQKKVNLRLVD